MDFSQLIYLILSLVCVWLLLGALKNNNLVNSITGNTEQRGGGFSNTRGSGFSKVVQA